MSANLQLYNLAISPLINLLDLTTKLLLKAVRYFVLPKRFYSFSYYLISSKEHSTYHSRNCETSFEKFEGPRYATECIVRDS